MLSCHLCLLLHVRVTLIFLILIVPRLITWYLYTFYLRCLMFNPKLTVYTLQSYLSPNQIYLTVMMQVFHNLNTWIKKTF